MLSMTLSPREREILALLQAQPMLDAAGLARSLGTTKGAIAVALSSLSQKGEIVGRGYILRAEPWAVVVGGAAWDVKARSLAAARLHTSNPSRISRTPGEWDATSPKGSPGWAAGCTWWPRSALIPPARSCWRSPLKRGVRRSGGQ